MSLTQEQQDLLQTTAGLVLRHQVDSDGETTTMRSMSEIKELSNLQAGASCSDQVKVMASVFRFRGKPQNFPGANRA